MNKAESFVFKDADTKTMEFLKKYSRVCPKFKYENTVSVGQRALIDFVNEIKTDFAEKEKQDVLKPIADYISKDPDKGAFIMWLCHYINNKLK
jgi:hypothetical protein